MRFVSLNLDVRDALALRFALGNAVATCPCRQLQPRRPCEQCRALAAVVADLDRMLDPTGATTQQAATAVGVGGRAGSPATVTDRDPDHASSTDLGWRVLRGGLP